MKLIKSDWALFLEAQEKGLVVSMTSIVDRNRTERNNRLMDYFREQMPKYSSIFDEDITEDILFSINEYLEEMGSDKRIDFPLTCGSEVSLIPIGDNIQLKILTSDEYYGDGEYSKYIEIAQFLMNDETSESDVDLLIEFVKKYLYFGKYN